MGSQGGEPTDSQPGLSRFGPGQGPARPGRGRPHGTSGGAPKGWTAGDRRSARTEAPRGPDRPARTGVPDTAGPKPVYSTAYRMVIACM